MTQSAIYDALLIAGDALQDGRLDDCEGVLAEMDAMGAWEWDAQLSTAIQSDRVGRGLAKLAWRMRRIGGQPNFLPSTVERMTHVIINGEPVPVMEDPTCPPGELYYMNGTLTDGATGPIVVVHPSRRGSLPLVHPQTPSASLASTPHAPHLER